MKRTLDRRRAAFGGGAAALLIAAVLAWRGCGGEPPEPPEPTLFVELIYEQAPEPFDDEPVVPRASPLDLPGYVHDAGVVRPATSAPPGPARALVGLRMHFLDQRHPDTLQELAVASGPAFAWNPAAAAGLDAFEPTAWVRVPFDVNVAFDGTSARLTAGSSTLTLAPGVRGTLATGKLTMSFDDYVGRLGLGDLTPERREAIAERVGRAPDGTVTVHARLSAVNHGPATLGPRLQPESSDAPPRVRLSGTVTLPEPPERPVRIRVLRDGDPDGYVFASGWVIDGRYALDVPPGAYRVAAYARGYTLIEQPADLTAPREIHFAFTKEHRRRGGLLRPAPYPTLAEYSWTFTFYETVVFEASDAFHLHFHYDSDWPVASLGAHLNLGAVLYQDPDDAEETVEIPAYVVNLRNMLVAAKTYFAGIGLGEDSFSGSNRMNVYVADMGGERNARSGEKSSGTLAQTVANWPYGRMSFDYGLSMDRLLTRAVHEYFHVVQAKRWKISKFRRLAEKIAAESTAEWAGDEPVPITLVGMRRPWRTTDDINQYYASRRAWFPWQNLGFFTFADGSDEYDRVFLFKLLAEHHGGSAAIKTFYDRFNDRTFANPRTFVESVASAVSGEGRRHDRFARFYTDLVAANIVQRGGPIGFADDAFSGNRAMNLLSPVRSVNAQHTSATPAAVERTAATDDADILRRLRAVRVDVDPVNPVGSVYRYVSLDPGTETPSRAQAATRMFLAVFAERAAGAALLTLRADRANSRGPNSRFTRIDLAPLEAGQGALAVLENLTPVGSPSGDHFVWIGFANPAESGEAVPMSFAFVITPYFERAYESEAPPSTATVNLVEVRPSTQDRSGPFGPDDRLTLEIDLSAIVHTGGGSRIPPDSRSLEIEVLGANGTPMEVGEPSVSCVNTEQAVYRYSFTLPESLTEDGTARVRFTVRSLLKLGERDRNVDESFTFPYRADRPQLDHVHVSRGAETFYAEPGGRFRPVTPGPVEVRVRFDMDMDRATPAEVWFGRTPMQGDWTGEREWTGRIEVPDPPGDWKGWEPILIRGKSAKGAWSEGETEWNGKTWFGTHRVLVGAMPPYVERVHVVAAGDTVYDAQWTGGPELDHVLSVTQAALGDARRDLTVRTARALPPQGQATIYVETSQPFEQAPGVRVGGESVPMQAGGHNRVWSGSFDLAKVQAGAIVPVRIEGRDRFGDAFDGDPRTVPVVRPEGTPWTRYEAERGGADTGAGGADTWHELGPTPTISLVLILDASGSMKDGGKMDNAKGGIRALLDGMTPEVEVGIVVFSDCADIQAVGFTRDLASIRARVDRTYPYQATPLAAALDRAAALLANSAHPGASEWRFAVFSDGFDTCDGDVVGAMRRLQQVASSHRPPEPRREADEPPPPLPPAVECRPASWRTYLVEVRDGGLHLDTIRLVEVRFEERQLADGRCQARLSIARYGVYFGRVGDRTRWGINSRPGRPDAREATTQDAVERLRAEAEALRGRGKSMEECRGEIAEAVRASLERVGDD